MNNIKLTETNSNFVKKVTLILPFETRYIGTINLSGEGTFTTIRKPYHIFRKLKALGINHELLTSKEIKFKWIIIQFEGRNLVTSRKYFLDKGKQYSFKKKGFELQVFLPITEFGINKARDYEKSTSPQSNLFQGVA